MQRKIQSKSLETIPLEEGDTSALDIVEDMKRNDIKLNQSLDPSEILEIDLRLREGKKYKEDGFLLNGDEFQVVQLSFINVRKAHRNALRTADGTPLGKKILYVMRTEAKNDDDIGELTLTDYLDIQNMSDVEDLWLIYYTLKESGHPIGQCDFEGARKYIEHIGDVEQLIHKIRKVNGLSDSKLDDDTPSGEDVLKSFRNDSVRKDVKG
jgi:hypothetical protein